MLVTLVHQKSVLLTNYSNSHRNKMPEFRGVGTTCIDNQLKPIIGKHK